jgi:hypothetical protein
MTTTPRLSRDTIAASGALALIVLSGWLGLAVALDTTPQAVAEQAAHGVVEIAEFVATWVRLAWTWAVEQTVGRLA